MMTIRRMMTVWCMLAGLALQADALDAFWASTRGKEMDRLPLSVVPVNAFCSFGNVHFEEPTPALENRVIDNFGSRSVYNVITLTLRSIPDLSDKVTQERAKNYFDRAHAAGIKVLMDIDARICRREFLKRWPDACASVVCFTRDEQMKFPSYRDHMAWGAERGYDAVAKKTLKKLPNGLMLVQFDLFAVDPATPKLTPFLEELARRYKKLGADGAMRDEWGFPPIRDFHESHTAFPYSPAFAAEYARVSGGRDYLADLAEIALGSPAARAAIDFTMRTIYEVCVRTEREFYDMNRRVFGEDVYVTKHPTWHCRFDASEFMHNGFDWWGVKRDWAQSDETIPLPCISGMAKVCGGPCWMNEGYGPFPEHYGFATWRYALCGGRMVYHGIYGTDSSVARRHADPKARSFHTSADILTPGNVRAQARVNLLNLITRAQVDAPVAFVFGHWRALNWLDAAYGDGGMKLAYRLGQAGRYVDAYPSSQFAEGAFSVDGDGYLKVGAQRYDALVLYRLSDADRADLDRVIAGRTLKTKVFAWDSPERADAVKLASSEDAAPILAWLDRVGAVRQTPLADYGLNWNGEDKLPYPDGTVTLLDGTKARIRGSMPLMEGDRIGGGRPLAFGNRAVAFDAVGLAAARLDKDGRLEAFAAGGLRSVKAPGLSLALSNREDIALVRRNGKWLGFWQTSDRAAQLPKELAALTDDWRILRLPSFEARTAAHPAVAKACEAVRSYRRSARVNLLAEARAAADACLGLQDLPADDVARLSAALLELAAFLPPAEGARYRAFAEKNLPPRAKSAADVRRAKIAAQLPAKAGLPGPAERKANAGQAAFWDLAEKANARPIAETNKALYDEFFETGNRTHYEERVFDRMEQLSILTVAEKLEGKGRFLPKIDRLMNAICDQPSWTFPAHDLHAGGRHNYRGTLRTVDLFGSETACHLAYAVSWLGDRLPAETVRRVKAEAETRIFTPLRRAYACVREDGGFDGDADCGNRWICRASNWCAVCHDNVTAAALALLDDSADRALFVEMAVRQMAAYADSFTEDGYCSEGMGYWNYGFGHYLMLRLMLKQVNVTGGNLDLPIFRKVAEYAFAYQLEPGFSPAFADGNGSPSAPNLAMVAQIWPELGACASSSCDDLSKLVFGAGRGPCINRFAALISPKRRSAADACDAPLPLRTSFDAAQVWLLRAGKELSVAVKGGHNAELHNHNDVGSYYLMSDGRFLTGDPGNELYTARTFSAHRYDSKVLNSYGHPVPVVGGQLQGKGRACAAKVVKRALTDERDEIVLDLTAAYPCKTLVSLVRTFAFDRRAKTFAVTDRAVFSEPTTFETAYTKFSAPFQATVEVKKGGSHAVREEVIENPHRLSPTRVGIVLDRPATEAEVTVTFAAPPAEKPLFRAE